MAMMAMAAALRGPGGRFRWRTQATAGGVRGSARGAAGRAGRALCARRGSSRRGASSRVCPRGGVPAGSILGWDRSLQASRLSNPPSKWGNSCGTPLEVLLGEMICACSPTPSQVYSPGDYGGCDSPPEVTRRHHLHTPLVRLGHLLPESLVATHSRCSVFALLRIIDGRLPN